MEAPRHAEVAGYGPRGGVPPGRLDGTGEYEELHRLLREAIQLIENTDLRGASETLRKAGELASGRDPAAPGGRSRSGSTGRESAKEDLEGDGRSSIRRAGGR